MKNIFLKIITIVPFGERIRLQFIIVLSRRPYFGLTLLRELILIKKPYSFSVRVFILLPTSFSLSQWKSSTQEDVGDGAMDESGYQFWVLQTH